VLLYFLLKKVICYCNFVTCNLLLPNTACVHSRRNTPDFIIAPNLWLLNISDFSPVDYRLLAMLLEWVCQYLVRHVDKLRQRLIDRQTVIDQAINRW